MICVLCEHMWTIPSTNISLLFLLLDIKVTSKIFLLPKQRLTLRQTLWVPRAASALPLPPLSQRFTFICKLLFTTVMQVSLFLFIEASYLKKAVTLEKQWFGAGHSKYAFSFVFCCSFSPWYYLQHIFFSLKSLSDHCSTQRLTSMVAKVLADFYIILKRAQQTSQQLC